MGSRWVYKSMSVERCGWVHQGGGGIFGIGLELEQCECGQWWEIEYWSHCSSVARYSRRDCQARKNWTIRGYGIIYKLKVLKWSGGDWIRVPKCFPQWSIPSRKSGIFGVIWVPYEIRWSRLRTLLHYLWHQGVVLKRKDHVLQWSDKVREVRHEKHRVFSRYMGALVNKWEGIERGWFWRVLFVMIGTFLFMNLALFPECILSYCDTW